MAERPVLAVLVRTDSFAELWDQLAESVGARVRTGATLSGLAPLREACGIALACAGAEARAPEWLEEVRDAGGGSVAVVGAEADHRIAVAAVRAGAAEYFALPADLEALRTWLAERVERWRASRRAEALAESERRDYDFSRLIGHSDGLRVAIERAGRLIPHGETTVLITGETGTGKELLAQAIHYNGPRAAQPFLEVNCTALPPTLLEAELFGYEKGAFTDARAAKPGLFEAAHGGTLFLDEIGDLGLEAQAKLLKLLEDKQVRRLGSLRSMQVDVRIIAATHVDLPGAVAQGRFRDDLFYRLSVVPIELPPLRVRGDDITLLAEHFIAAFADAFDITPPPLTDELRRALLTHAWPGNVRELRNAMERLVLLGGSLQADELLPPAPGAAATGGPLPFPAPLDRIERAAAHAMLDHLGGNKSAAADALGISRSRLYRLLE